MDLKKIASEFDGHKPSIDAYMQQELSKWFLGNADAVRLIQETFAALHLWDDLIDRDKPVADDAINAAFWSMLVGIPQNPFYHRVASMFVPTMINAIVQWKTATKFERNGGEYEKTIAYVLRSSYIDLITICALVIGGPAHAEIVAAQARYETHGEGLAGYFDNLAKETRLRENGQ